MVFLVDIVEFIPWLVLIFYPWKHDALRKLFSTYLSPLHALGALSSVLMIVLSVIIHGNDLVTWAFWLLRILSVSLLILIICGFVNRVALALVKEPHE